MLSLLSGTDQFRLLERKRALEESFFRTHPDGEKFAFDIEEIWDESKRSLLSGALASSGLFATPHLVVIRGTEALDEKSGEWLAQVLASHDASVTAIGLLVLAPKKKLPSWWQALAKTTTVTHETFNAANGSEQEQFITLTLKEYGTTIEPTAKRFLVAAFPKDMGGLVQTVRSLSLAAADGVITLKQAQGTVTLSREHNVFAALDCLARRDHARAIALFRSEETDADAPFALLGLCAWQVRRLIAVKELAEVEGMNAARIATELKAAPYPIQKTLPLVARLTFPKLRRALVLLADFDQAIKTGRMRPGVALDLFVWKF